MLSTRPLRFRLSGSYLRTTLGILDHVRAMITTIPPSTSSRLLRLSFTSKSYSRAVFISRDSLKRDACPGSVPIMTSIPMFPIFSNVSTMFALFAYSLRWKLLVTTLSPVSLLRVSRLSSFQFSWFNRPCVDSASVTILSSRRWPIRALNPSSISSIEPEASASIVVPAIACVLARVRLRIQ